MTFPEAFRTRLKWSIYEWLGAISICEVKHNQHLIEQIEELSRSLSALAT